MVGVCQSVVVGVLGGARQSVVVRVVQVEERCPRLRADARQPRFAMVQEHRVACGRGRVSDGVGHVQSLFSGDDESYAIVPVGIFDLETQLGVRDSVCKVSQ